MQILSKHKIFNMVGLASTGVLAGLALVTLCPSAMDGASAESEIPVSINVENYLDVALSGAEKATMSIQPSKDGSFIDSGDIKLNVSTNNPTGYRLTMATKDSTTSLVNAAGDSIDSITVNTDEESFPLNQWGYKMSTTANIAELYSRIPSSGAVIDDNREKEAETYTFSFGAKVDAQKTGTYSNTIILSAVANPITISNLTELTYMQDMNSNICADTVINADLKDPVTKQLVDSRDGKRYWVSKLADGNCWMTQNLDLDIPAEGLKAADTDITSDWTNPTAATIKDNNFDTGNDNTTSYSWDVGEYMVTDSATNSTSCANIASGTDPINKDCDRLKPYDNVATNAHYLVGNYYQWDAATAGTGTELTEYGVDAPGSICPKGWQLPQDSNSSVASDASVTYVKLYNVYGNGQIALVTKPLYFLRTGIVYSDGRGYTTAGYAGSYWTRTLYSDSRPYAFFFDDSSRVIVSNWGVRNQGMSVRCIAR